MKSFLILLTMICGLQIANASDADILLRQYKKSVVLYKAFGGGGGTAFYVSPRELISARHVCEMLGHLENGQVIQEIILSEVNDLCYIKVKYKSEYYLSVSKQPRKYGIDFCSAGFAGVKYYTISCSKLTMILIMVDEYGKYLTLGGKVTVQPGMSGGPTMNNGEVVGVNVMADNVGNGYFVGHEQINTFLEWARK